MSGAGPAELRGVAASPGIAIGRVHPLRQEALAVPERVLPAAQVAGEIERLRAAAGHARARLERIHRSVSGLELVDAIFRTQLMILEDRQLLDDAARHIRERRINAEWALRIEQDRLNGLFDAMQDAYLRERRADVNFALRQLLMSLLGREPEGVGALDGPTVVVAHDLSPAETAQLDRARVVALATDAGGRTSHAVIMANSLGIPAVVGLESITGAARQGDLAIVDGRTGCVLLRPPPATVRRYAERARQEQARERALLRCVDLPSETRDGRPIELRANIERADEVAVARSCGARGVGLFRTEFLFMNRAELPGEEEQVREYAAVLAGVAPWPAAIRTVDLGGEKLPLPGLRRLEANPALGLRGIRLAAAPASGGGGSRATLYAAQLRAMLRASPAGRLRILLPLVTGVEEVRAARQAIAELRGELESEGRAVAERVELGVVVETPAAVAIVDLLAREVDFFSIGTNDLIQYIVAVDRGNEAVAYLYDPGHPAVLRAIRTVVEGAHAAQRPVGVCGEMAGDPLYALLLVGLGVDELSMNAPAIPRVKRIVREIEQPEARALASGLLQLRTAAEVGEELRKEMRRRFPDEFEPDSRVP